MPIAQPWGGNRETRISVGRALYPAADRATARRDLAEALAQSRADHVRRGLLAADASLEETLTRFHILHGHPDEIGEALAAEQAVIGWTDLLVQIDLGICHTTRRCGPWSVWRQRLRPIWLWPTLELA